jgi:ethanolamine utilization protein EutA
MELSSLVECYRSPVSFTPIINENIDIDQVECLLDEWLKTPDEYPIFGGGALLTGLTAQSKNAAVLIDRIRRRIGDAVVARADDPRMESWLAFMGSATKLSTQNPQTPIINLDIGGGTTNLAVGLNGEVLATGCLFVGARHIRVEPGTYRIVAMSTYAKSLLNYLQIPKGLGSLLAKSDLDAIFDCYLDWILASIHGDVSKFQDPIAAIHQQVPLWTRPERLKEVLRSKPIITLSGGVGELVYSTLKGNSFPSTTMFGDLGIDLAKRILSHPDWADDFQTHIPQGGGRATSFGLLRHSTQISGSTLGVGKLKILPLRDVPIIGTIDSTLPDLQWQAILDLLKSSSAAMCLQIVMNELSAESVRVLGTTIASSLESIGFPSDQPLVIMVSANVGKTLGAYITRWDMLDLSLLVIDEIPATDASFVQIGRFHGQIVPVSFYGLQR